MISKLFLFLICVFLLAFSTLLLSGWCLYPEGVFFGKFRGSMIRPGNDTACVVSPALSPFNLLSECESSLSWGEKKFLGRNFP